MRALRRLPLFLIVTTAMALVCYYSARAQFYSDWRARGGVVKKIELDEAPMLVLLEIQPPPSRPSSVLSRSLAKLQLPKPPEGASKVTAQEALDAYNQCLKEHLLVGDDRNSIERWNRFHSAIQQCRNSVWQMRDILSSLHPYVNLYEIKWSIDMDPEIKSSMPPGKCTIVTLGVGLDVRVELQMQKRYNDTCSFFGADPVREINEDLYQHVGQFFPFAIGASVGSFTSKILAADPQTEQSNYNRLLDYLYGRTYFWVPRHVVHIDLPSFINNVIKRPIIDILLLDIEGGETALLPMFVKGGALDQNNVVVCSIIMEFHSQRKGAFPDWITSLVEDKRFVFLQSDTIWQHRQFLAVNVEQQPCFDRYVKRFFVDS